MAEIVRLRAALARVGIDADRIADANGLEVGRTELMARIANKELQRVSTELEAGRAALAATEDRYRVVLESATDYAIITSDCDGRITGWNTGARNVLGWEEAEVLGQPMDVFFTPEDREAGAPAGEMRTAREAGRSADERWHLRRDGSRFWGSGQLMPLQDGGAPCLATKLRGLLEGDGAARA